MKGVFKIRINDEIQTFSEYDDIPQEFEHLILFNPEIPEGPHTDEEHEYIEQLNDRMKELMKRETG